MANIVCESKAILPTKFDTDAIINSLPAGLRAAAAQILRDFNSTAENWHHKPTFTVTPKGKDEITITTTDENWIRVDRGTKSKGRVTARKGPSGKRAHRIVKRTPKSKAGTIRSSGGGPTGEVVFRASYRHTGITPRHFTEAVAEKNATTYPNTVLKTLEGGINAGISSTSKEVKVKA